MAIGVGLDGGDQPSLPDQPPYDAKIMGERRTINLCP
jgi:hypothetical protein